MSESKYVPGEPLKLLLAEFQIPHTREQAIERLRRLPGLRDKDIPTLLDELIRIQFLSDARERAQLPSFETGYANALWHAMMLADMARNTAFKQAIDMVVRPGDTVIDVGAGTGILSLFAASAGAKKVYGIETTEILQAARNVAKANGFEQTIEYVHGNAKSLDHDIKADVVISEWIGVFLLEEYMYDAFVAVRNKCLKPGGKVIPRAARLYLSPIEHSELHATDGFGFWDRPVCGYDFSALKAYQQQSCYIRWTESKAIPWHCQLAEPAEILAIDCEKDGPEIAHFDRTVAFVVQRSAPFHGFLGYFDLEMAPGIVLSTSTLAAQTHWGQTYLPIPAFNVEKNDRMEVHVTTTQGSMRPVVTLRGTVLRDSKRVHTFEQAYIGS